jgi:polyprenyl-phospho-N-acetylgalactosaminyl synthase
MWGVDQFLLCLLPLALAASSSDPLGRDSWMSYRADAVWVIVAAYNEEHTLSEVIAGLHLAGYRVLVIDDGSLDSTAETATRSGALVIKHPINLGQGAALQTGLDFALAAGAQYLVTFDADGQHRACDIAGLIDAIHNLRIDYALGSRFLGGAPGIPFSRLILLRAAIWFTRLTTRLKVTDAHNGLRAMTRRGAQNIKIRQNRMAHASELLNQIANSGLGFVEVPVSIAYSEYSLSKGQMTNGAINILLDLFLRKLYQ